MANIHLESSLNGGNIRLDTNGNGGSMNVKESSMPKYVGARATVTRTEDGAKIWMSDYKGETEATIADGQDGQDGQDGTDGVGIASIEKTSTSGFVDTYTITYTDGNTDTFDVTNGANGVTDVKVDGTSVVTSGVASIDLTGKADVSSLATVATTGDYDDLTDKPTIPTVPTNVSAFTNDAGYLTSYTETDPTVPSWAKASSKPTYTYSEVGAAASVHNHSDATTSAAGFMSTTDKTKLNGLPNIYTSTSSPTASDGANGDLWFVY